MSLKLNNQNATMTFLLFAGLGFNLACKTLSPTVKVDRNEKKITLYSSSDKNSALADPRKSSAVQESAEVLQSKLKKEPDDVNVMLDLANIYLVQGKFTEAAATCRKALAYNLKNTNGRKLLGRIELESGNTEKAEIIFNGLGGATSKDADILNSLGIIALRRKQIPLAYEHFNRGIKASPDNVEIRMNLGTLYLHYRQIQPASIQFERVLQIIPDHADAMLHLGIAKATRGDFQNASEMYKKVLAIQDSNPIVRFNLAVAQKELGNLENALDNVKDFLKQKDLAQEKFKAGEQLRDEIENAIEKRRREEEEKNKKKEEVQTLSAKTLRKEPEAKPGKPAPPPPQDKK